HESEPEHGIFELAVGQGRTYRADLSGFVNDLKEFGQKRSLSSKYMTFDLDGYGPIVIDADHVLILSRFSASYSSESDTLEYLSIEGYLLEK
ncbi:MAG: hypothetical protein K6E62_13555, partial [Lachnospiraceae bacterium]|nr:hypothetical protein [Lachnospiraceae bacterium]